MTSPPLEESARERVRATRLALSLDTVALLVAAVVVVAIVVGALPPVPW
jgi:hypothetical protein